MFNGVKTAFLEDSEVFRAQQESRDAGAAAIPEILTPHDKAAVQANRILQRLIEEQLTGAPALYSASELKYGPWDIR